MPVKLEEAAKPKVEVATKERFPLASLCIKVLTAGAAVGRVKLYDDANDVVASNLMVVWFVVLPVLNIKLAAEATPLEPN